MYLPEKFSQHDRGAIHELIRLHPLGCLVTAGGNGLTANHIPLLLRDTDTGNGTLMGHIAKANPMTEFAKRPSETLVVFQGPNAYISPSWCPSKADKHEIVPTWNYAVVHAHGQLEIIQDKAWIRAHLDDLTQEFEAQAGEHWSLSDAPDTYVERLVEHVVGIRIPIDKLVGKWKTTIREAEINLARVTDSLTAMGTDDATDMVRLIAERYGVGRDG